jgi:hypothetical protein
MATHRIGNSLQKTFHRLNSLTRIFGTVSLTKLADPESKNLHPTKLVTATFLHDVL